ncbi:hypothetical protein HBI12_068570 [Parastagonospora nodorum]|nr:hypothetical protein HBI12_068570 [Parastagonospora nodorum]
MGCWGISDIARAIEQSSTITAWGEIYRDVVQTCLNGSFEAVGAEEGNPGAAELHYSFKRLVVDQLQKCSA